MFRGTALWRGLFSDPFLCGAHTLVSLPLGTLREVASSTQAIRPRPFWLLPGFRSHPNTLTFPGALAGHRSAELGLNPAGARARPWSSQPRRVAKTPRGAEGLRAGQSWLGALGEHANEQRAGDAPRLGHAVPLRPAGGAQLAAAGSPGLSKPLSAALRAPHQRSLQRHKSAL